MMARLAEAPISEWRIQAMIREMTRVALAQMMARQEAPFDPRESETFCADLERRQQAVTCARRTRE